jgi:uncharacterized repeat protein (TIGR03847 family)
MSTSPSFDLGAVDAFTAGTVGAPGQRVFFLQARADGQVVTVKCEKQQVAALGQYLERLLQDLPAPGDGPLPTALELLDPVDAVWVAGQLAVAWEADADRFVVEVEELDPEAPEAVENDDDDDDDKDDDEDDGDDDDSSSGVGSDPLDWLVTFDRGRLRFELSRGQALAFAARAVELVAAGRPSCRFCGLPIDPDGHPCPRMN